jgi:SpoVK/Ycf46/Vps4 family AAA+-type ATPase
VGLDLEDFGRDAGAGEARGRRLPPWVARRDRRGGRQWIRAGARRYRAARHELVRALPPGLYTLARDHLGETVFERRDVRVDALIRLPGGVADTVLLEVERFWALAPTFAAHGFLHRRGYLLYGPHGCGKTSIVQQIVRDAVAAQGIVFVCGAPALLARGLTTLRRIEPARPVVCIFEDIDAIVQAHGEDELLALLDGEARIDHVLNVATTNYPERLDRRFVARPRRFDRVLRLEPPDGAARRAFLAAKLGADDAEVERWVAATAGLSLAALAEAVISVRCLGRALDETVELLRRMSRGRASSREGTLGAGFTAGRGG